MGGNKNIKKSIKVKMLLGILPVIAITMIAITLVSVFFAKSIIVSQVEENMRIELAGQKNVIQSQLEQLTSASISVATSTAACRETATDKTYNTIVTQTIANTDLLCSAAVYLSDSTDGAPYAYKDGQAVLLGKYPGTYKEEEFYKEAGYRSGTFFSPIEVNERGVSVMRAITPMADESYKPIGCTAADLDMSIICDNIEGIQIGEAGKAILVAETGKFIAGVDNDKISAGMLISDDEEFVSVSEEIMSNQTGSITFLAGGKGQYLFYDTISATGWKLLIIVPESQIYAPVYKIAFVLIAVAIVALIICMMAIIAQVRTISRDINKVNDFASVLAAGDYTVTALDSKRSDELGQMGSALNSMYNNTRDIISKISLRADELDQSAISLNNASENLSRQFGEIRLLMGKVNDDMINASAATEEINASAEEVTASVNVLADKTADCMSMTSGIKKRAQQVEKNSKQSYEYASALSKMHKKNLEKSIEDAKVVEAIETMAQVISNIASQIDLLSLNASIEAAKAGDAGRGFAVVASEVGKLAGDTTLAVANIQETILAVKSAVESIMESSEALLKFVDETVTPDYDKFMEVAKQYGNDAASLEEISSNISSMAVNMEHIMNEVAKSMQDIALSTQNTSDTSQLVTKTVEDAASVMNSVADMSKGQEQIAGDLNDAVGQFKLM